MADNDTPTATPRAKAAAKKIDWANAKKGDKVDPDAARDVDVDAVNEQIKATDLKLVADTDVQGGLVVTHVEI